MRVNISRQRRVWENGFGGPYKDVYERYKEDAEIEITGYGDNRQMVMNGELYHGIFNMYITDAIYLACFPTDNSECLHLRMSPC